MTKDLLQNDQSAQTQSTVRFPLNEPQQQAASILSGPVLVLAGAGAGKTKTLTERIINLIESGTHPQAILAITFTNKAAGEMKERVIAAMKESTKINFPVYDYGIVPWVGTFHALGVMIIRDQHSKLGIKKHFTIYDRDDSRRAVREAVKACDLDPKQWDTKKVLGFISKNKGNYISLNDFTSTSESSFYTDYMTEIWQAYEKIKTKDGALDFDDLLLETAKLLENDSEVRTLYQTKFQHVHVDEYQDTNKVQYRIVQLLVNPETNNLFVVGDPDQLIYAWRGAELKNILRFEKDFKNAKTVLLEQNYRSSGAIIEASNAVIAHNKDRFKKRLFTENPQGELIGLCSAYDAREEVRWVVQKIQQHIKDGQNPQNIAVLYRANFQSRLLEEACLYADIPYQVLGTKFFDRSEVKDVLSYIRAAFNPDGLVDVRRVINQPKRGIGKVSLVKILAGKADDLPARLQGQLQKFRDTLKEIRDFAAEYSPSEVVQFVIARSGLEAMYRETGKEEDMERLANMYELAAVAEKYDTLPPEDDMSSQETGMQKFLEDIALMGDQDTKNDQVDAVKLMTIHASKGLEFETVFISGCEESLFSPQMDMDKKASEAKSEEERRLFYVAMTRAKTKLYLSWTTMREVFGSTMVNTLCGFVTDVPDNLIEEETTSSSRAFENRYAHYDGVDDSSDGDDVIEYLDF